MLQIAYKEFYEILDLRIIINAIRANYKMRNEESLDKWRQMRYMAMLYYNSQVKKSEQIRDPRKFMLLPGEKLPKPTKLSKEKFEKLIVKDG